MLDKKDAINALKEAIDQIYNLRSSQRFSREHTRWLTNTLYLLEDVFGPNSMIYRNFCALTWTFRGSSVVTMEYDMERKIEKKMHEGYLKDLDTAQGILESAIDRIKRRGIEDVYEGKDTPKEASEIVKIVSLIENNLRKVIRKEPKKETEISDALENLFIGANLSKDFTREKERVLYSLKTYTPDFVFKRISTVVDAKLCDSEQRMKQIIKEINDYSVAFKTKYDNVIFVVYDLGIIRDEELFKEGMKDMIVKIIKH